VRQHTPQLPPHWPDALPANCAAPCSSLQTATTDESGRFSFACAGDCTGGVVTLPPSGQPEGCADSLTQLPPPFVMQAPASPLPEGATLLGAEHKGTCMTAYA
jgi:hypothetical protein